MKECIFSIFLLLLLSQLVIGQISMPDRRKIIAEKLSGTMGTYAAPPTLESGEVDYKKLLRQLKDIHANTYHWLDRDGYNDINALRTFLPMAKKAKIKVWVTLVPPSESPPFSKHYSEPYKLDYHQWAVALANLSLQFPNLVAWSIDDFVHNLQLFTPEYVQQFLDASRKINPSLAFIPCCYYKKTNEAFVKNYGSFLDGILFPYRNESVMANLKDADQVKPEIEKLRSIFDKGFLIFLDVYASAHSRLGTSTPDYVKEVVSAGLESADGVLIYRHQDPVKYPGKYDIVKKAFKTGMHRK